MNAERQLHGWRWLSSQSLERERPSLLRKPHQRRARRHADWILELALMLVLSLVLPRCRHARK